MSVVINRKHNALFACERNQLVRVGDVDDKRFFGDGVQPRFQHDLRNRGVIDMRHNHNTQIDFATLCHLLCISESGNRITLLLFRSAEAVGIPIAYSCQLKSVGLCNHTGVMAAHIK